MSQRLAPQRSTLRPHAHTSGPRRNPAHQRRLPQEHSHRELLQHLAGGPLSLRVGRAQVPAQIQLMRCGSGGCSTLTPGNEYS